MMADKRKLVVDGPVASAVLGFAVRIGKYTVQIIKDKPYIDGKEYPTQYPVKYPADLITNTENPKSNVKMSLCDCGNSTGVSGYFSAHSNPMKEAGGGWYINW